MVDGCGDPISLAKYVSTKAYIYVYIHIDALAQLILFLWPEKILQKHIYIYVYIHIAALAQIAILRIHTYINSFLRIDWPAEPLSLARDDSTKACIYIYVYIHIAALADDSARAYIYMYIYIAAL
uniref:Uncharacterized protein n=1 Tax=Glossina morsitans morsitans TaxID=37546 RepID=A0A1B0GEY1_GLOMM